jgi:two-component system chemotaxis response regulator CheY
MGVKHILIVDDSPTMRRMVRASLGTLPETQFTEAGSGLDALEKLALGNVDLVILDLNMPDMHGMEVLRFVRQHQVYRNLPIIILTTRGDDTGRTEAMNAGASLYLTKPFEPHTLAAQARSLLT